MQNIKRNVSIVEIGKVELHDAIIAQHGELKATGAAFMPGAGPSSPTKFLGLVFGITRDQLDAVLRPLIQGLPPLGSYSARCIDEADKPDVCMRVRWIAAE